MKKIIFLIGMLFPNLFYSQAWLALRSPENPVDWYFKDINGETTSYSQLPYSGVFMSIESSKIAEYWGQKGITSGPLIDSLRQDIRLCDLQRDMYSRLYWNKSEEVMEYRDQLKRTATLLQDSEKAFIKQEALTAEWEKKAKRRGKALAGAGAAVGLIIAGIIIGG